MLLDLFWRRKKSVFVDEEDAPEEELVLDAGTKLLPPVRRRLDTDMPVEVLGRNAEVLFNARIIAGNDVRLTLGRLPGALSFKPLVVDEPVVLKAYDTTQEHVHVHGTILKSSVTEIVIRDWSIGERITNRDGARLPLSVPGQLYELSDKYRKHPRECFLSDLSLSGARISTSEELAVGDEFNLNFEVLKDDGRITCHAQVVWVTVVDMNLYEYGLLFAQLEGWRAHSLEESFVALRESIARKTHS